jgi:hypothetical protein
VTWRPFAWTSTGFDHGNKLGVAVTVMGGDGAIRRNAVLVPTPHYGGPGLKAPAYAYGMRVLEAWIAALNTGRDWPDPPPPATDRLLRGILGEPPWPP